MHQAVRTGRIRCGQEDFTERGSRSPSFFELQSGAESTADYVECAALVSVDVAPTAGTGRDPRVVTAERDGSGSCDNNDSGRACRSAGKRDLGVMRDLKMLAAN